MNTQQKIWLQLSVGAILLTVIAGLGWQRFGNNSHEDGILSGNGRIEGVEIDVAAKSAGRLKDTQHGLYHPRSGHPVSRGRILGSVAAIRCASGDQDGLVHTITRAISEDGGSDGMSTHSKLVMPASMDI